MREKFPRENPQRVFCKSFSFWRNNIRMELTEKKHHIQRALFSCGHKTFMNSLDSSKRYAFSNASSVPSVLRFLLFQSFPTESYLFHMTVWSVCALIDSDCILPSIIHFNFSSEITSCSMNENETDRESQTKTSTSDIPKQINSFVADTIPKKTATPSNKK